MADNADLAARLSALSDQIRRGRIAEACQELKQFTRFEDVPDSLKGQLANLFRRAGLSMKSIRLLNARVRPVDKRQLQEPATPLEICEYGAALANIGATREALSLLRSVNGDQHPSALLFEGFAQMGTWDYDQAVLSLREYVEVASITPYEKLLGQLNLSASLIFEREYDEAEELLMQLVQDFAAQGHKFLEGSAEELLAQISFYKDDLDRADAHLQRTRDLNPNHWVGVYARKWRAILKLARPTTSTEGRDELKALQKESIEQGHWETARDCDYRLALADKNVPVLTKLFAGTPFPRYRTRVAAALKAQGVDAELESTGYSWMPFGPASAALRTLPRLSLAEPSVDGRELAVKADSLVHRLLKLLARDFYAPTRLATLFAELHPDAVFNPRSSPDTIHQLLGRLREALAELPVSVSARNGAFALHAGAPICVVLGQATAAKAPEASSLEARFGENVFSIGEAQSHFDMGRRWTQQKLADLTREGALERLGSGKMQRYRMRRAA